MNKLIQQIEKGKPFFEKISRNIYLGAIRDGFLAAMPAILFSSIFILIASIPDVLGVKLPEDVSAWLWKIYNYSMGVVALLVSATTARCLAESVNRKMPANKKINAVSVMLASIVSFLLLSVDQIDKGLASGYMGTKGILAAFVAAFITVNMYKFCVLKDITIKMPKEVPGTISQTFRDIFPFSFAVFAAVIIDTLIRHFFGHSFAEAVISLMQPLFSAADGYLGIAIIWGAMALFWFVGVHGPSIVEPAIVAVIYANVETNLQLVKAGEQASNVLTVGLGNFVGTMGGTGATLVVPFLFLLFAKSKQLKAVGKASFIPVSFAVNEPLLFATPIILNPYFFVYIKDNGEILLNFIQSKKILDIYKKVCSGKNELYPDLIKEFNEETSNAKDMSKFTDFLEKTVENIVGKEEEKGIESLFSFDKTTLNKSVQNMDDFELISFLVIK